MASAARTVRLAAVGDIHCTRNSQGVLRNLFADVAANMARRLPTDEETGAEPIA